MTEKRFTLSILVAVSANGVIGRDNDLPWRIPADLKRFKELTLGHTLLMGRKTFESIGRPLPGRRTVVISRRRDFIPAGVELARSPEEAMQRASSNTEVFVVGGAAIYAHFLPLADRLYLTRIHADLAGDVHFPDFDETEWKQVSREDHEPDGVNSMPYSFMVYERG